MKNRAYILVIFILLVGFFTAPATAEDSKKTREHQIKAAFMYNFIKFIDWPEEKILDSNEPITIGIIGPEDFVNAFKPIKNKKIKDRQVVVKHLRNLKEQEPSERKDTIEAFRKCHLLFICSSEKENSAIIIEALKGASVLTVGETAGFLDSGGIINFLIEDKKVRFEINNFAAKQASLKIRSKLLRLARRVIEEKPSGDTKK